MHNKLNTENDFEPARIYLFRAYLFLFTFLIIIGWILSWLHALNWDIALAVLGLVGTILYLKKRINTWPRLIEAVKEPVFWPFLLVATMMVATALIFPPTMLDSLTYRLPRIWLWLHENHIYFINCADSRLNYMPQGWELATLPLIQLAEDKLVWVWSFISWVIMYFIAYDWAINLSGDKIKSRSMAFIVVASSFAVLQGRSSATDLVGTTMIALSLYFIIRFEQTRQWNEIIWAILSFCLATNIKPHFSVLGLAIVIWFWLSPSKPWRAFRWIWTPALLALWLISSAAPSFVMNQQHYGTLAGPGQDDSMKGKSPLINVPVGVAMITWQSIQLPINPLALLINPPLLKLTEQSVIKKEVPRFGLKIPVITMVDSATFGAVLSGLLTAGIYMAMKKRQTPLKSWQVLTALSSLGCTLLTLTHFVSGASGRAYYGFLFLLVPLAMIGWNLFNPKTLRYGLYLSLFNSILLLVCDPSKPLWPVMATDRMIAQYPSFAVFHRGLKYYLLIPERAHVAEQLVNKIPQTEKTLAAFTSEDSPLLSLFRPYSINREIKFFSPHIQPGLLEHSNIEYVIIDSRADEFYPEICAYLKTSVDYKPIASRAYTSKISRGAEVWTLYQRVNSADNITSEN